MHKKDGLQVVCTATPHGVKVYYESGKKIYLPEQMMPKKTPASDRQLFKKSHLGLLLNPEEDRLTEEQKLLYNLSVYGLSCIPVKKLQGISHKDKKKLKKLFDKAQHCINRLKNKVLEEQMKIVFKAVPKKKLHALGLMSDFIMQDCSEAWDEPNDLPFSFLGITKSQVLEELRLLNLCLPPTLAALQAHPGSGKEPVGSQDRPHTLQDAPPSGSPGPREWQSNEGHPSAFHRRKH
jgi:hypothetical protein